MTFRRLIFALILGLTATLSPDVWAQASITFSPNLVVGRRDGRGDYPKPTEINYTDCVANPADYFDVAMILTATQGMGLEVWAGTSASCANEESRTTLIPTQCWIVASQANASSPIRLPVQSIIPHGRSDLDQPGTAADCERDASAEGSGSITLYFVLKNGDQQDKNAPAATLPAKYDLKGPTPPEISGLGVGDTRLYPRWEPKSAIQDATDYRAYCEPTTAEAGVNGAECTAPTLKAGSVPPVDFAFAETTINGTEVEVKNLTNFQRYACGVGASDALLNVGTLSELTCGTPQPVVGYYKAYRNAGGEAGGGWCSYGRHTKAGAVSVSAFALAALFLAGRRRRGAAR